MQLYFHSFHGLVLLTGDPQVFTFFSLISHLKVLKVDTAILGLPLDASKYGSLMLVLLVLKNQSCE